MTHTYSHDTLGGFIVYDPNRRLVAYAYPTSTYAEAAKRDPVKIAAAIARQTVSPDSPAAARPEWHEAMIARYIETRI